MERKEGFDMDGIGEDLLPLKRSYLTCFYSVLARSGYFPVAELATFRLINSRLQGHPTTHDNLPGVRIASGSLGQGLSVERCQAKKT
jgi:transketolase